MDIRQAMKRGTRQAPGVEGPAVVSNGPGVARAPVQESDGTFVDVPLGAAEDMVIQEYLSFLSKNGITQADVEQVLRSIISSGNVVWDFDLFDSIRVAFKIRPTWVNELILERLDKDTANSERVSMVRYNNLVAMYNLAASLVEYGENKYKIDTPADFDAAHERISNMPYIIQNALVNKLAIFDRTIAVATSDWAVKNFIRPQKES